MKTRKNNRLRQVGSDLSFFRDSCFFPLLGSIRLVSSLVSSSHLYFNKGIHLLLFYSNDLLMVDHLDGLYDDVDVSPRGHPWSLSHPSDLTTTWAPYPRQRRMPASTESIEPPCRHSTTPADNLSAPPPPRPPCIHTSTRHVRVLFRT